MRTSLDQSRFPDVLFAETVRLVEESGPLEDGEAMSEAFRARAGREERLIERARVLAQRLRLPAELQRWREVAGYVWIALAVLVFFIAYGIAAALIGGERSINAVLAFFVALGMHAATLVIWCLAALASFSSRPGALGRISLGHLFLRLVAWLPLDRGPHSLTMMRAATSVLQRARLLPWAFGFISHVVWAMAFVLILGALWFAFSFQAYRLTWETTILSGEFFVGFVRVTGWFPNLLGFPLPDTATLLEPGAAGSDQRAWAWWLIGCTFVYGLIPRVVLAGVSWFVWQRGKRSLKLDTSEPYFRKLLSRFEAMESSTVVDVEQRYVPDAATLQAADAAGIETPPEIHKTLAVVGFELPPEYRWPPGDIDQAAGLVDRISGAAKERRLLLNKLAQSKPAKLLLVFNLDSSPDRGTERFMREACATAMQCALLLAAPQPQSESPSASGSDSLSSAGAQRWKSWLQDTGMQHVHAFTDLAGAASWLKADHD